MYERFMSEREQAVNSITLSVGIKGIYGWDIKLHFFDDKEMVALEKLEAIDAWLRGRFGSEIEEHQ